VFVAIIAVVLALVRYQIYRIRHRPEDLDEVQDALLGMGTMQSVDKAHIGFTLLFNRRRQSYVAQPPLLNCSSDRASYHASDHVAPPRCVPSGVIVHNDLCCTHSFLLHAMFTLTFVFTHTHTHTQTHTHTHTHTTPLVRALVTFIRLTLTFVFPNTQQVRGSDRGAG
jgi:hypothetical protein